MIPNFSVAKGRKALVTGGAGGIGLGVVDRLIDNGVAVAAADVNKNQLNRIFEEKKRKDVLPIIIDVTSASSVRRGIGKVTTEFGGLDTLVNSAGVFEMTPFEEISEKKWDFVIDVNLKGTFLCCQAAMPHLRKSGRGRIVNLSSDAGKRGWPLISHYSASKFGVMGLTETLAAEFGKEGVIVNAVCPASIPGTGMGQKVLRQKVKRWGISAKEVLRRGAKSFPLGRLGTVEDVADAVLFLICENSSWISGVGLNVDGGELSG